MKSSVLVVALVLCLLQASLLVAAPTLTITESRLGTWSFAGLETPPVTVEVAASIPLLFEWSATPDGPNSTIADYRYGWDIVDFEDDDQWIIYWSDVQSAVPLTFYFGVHAFSVEVRDDAGVITRGTIMINITIIQAPALTIAEATRGDWLFVGPDGAPVSLTETVTDPVTPWDYEWWAYGEPGTGTLTYRYGWDITDPGDDSQWSPWSDVQNAEPVEFRAGSHSFRVEVKDDTGAVTRGTILIQISGPSGVKSATWSRIKAMFSE